MRPVLFLTTATLALAATPLHAQDLERPTDWLVRVDRPTAHDEMLARSLSGQSSYSPFLSIRVLSDVRYTQQFRDRLSIPSFLRGLDGLASRDRVVAIGLRSSRRLPLKV